MRGFAGVASAATMHKPVVQTKTQLFVASRLFAEQPRSTRSPARFEHPGQHQAVAKRRAAVRGHGKSLFAQPKATLVGERVGPSRRGLCARGATPEESLEFLTAAASSDKALDLHDSGYALSKTTTIELVRSIIVFKVCLSGLA